MGWQNGSARFVSVHIKREIITFDHPPNALPRGLIKISLLLLGQTTELENDSVVCFAESSHGALSLFVEPVIDRGWVGAVGYVPSIIIIILSTHYINNNNIFTKPEKSFPRGLKGIIHQD